VDRSRKLPPEPATNHHIHLRNLTMKRHAILILAASALLLGRAGGASGEVIYNLSDPTGNNLFFT
jgi:hypothetical protein